jgi:hypothetical protein
LQRSSVFARPKLLASIGRKWGVEFARAIGGAFSSVAPLADCCLSDFIGWLSAALMCQSETRRWQTEMELNSLLWSRCKQWQGKAWKLQKGQISSFQASSRHQISMHWESSVKRISIGAHGWPKMDFHGCASWKVFAMTSLGQLGSRDQGTIDVSQLRIPTTEAGLAQSLMEPSEPCRQCQECPDGRLSELSCLQPGVGIQCEEASHFRQRDAFQYQCKSHKITSGLALLMRCHLDSALKSAH